MYNFFILSNIYSTMDYKNSDDLVYMKNYIINLRSKVLMLEQDGDYANFILYSKILNNLIENKKLLQKNRKVPKI
jgi:hypothetical protein